MKQTISDVLSKSGFITAWTYTIINKDLNESMLPFYIYL